MADADVPQPKWEGPLDEEGLPHGTGLMTYPPPPALDEDDAEQDPSPGDTYQGSMVHGKRHGHGRYIWGAQGATFDGEYSDNRRQGLGVMTFPDKGRYEGAFAADKLEGEGTYTYSNGDIYTGNFKAGKKHGRGQLFFKAQSCLYIGVWADGQFMEGSWVQKDGTSFQGSFESSIPKTGTFSFSRSALVQSGTYSRSTGWQAAAAAEAVCMQS